MKRIILISVVLLAAVWGVWGVWVSAAEKPKDSKDAKETKDKFAPPKQPVMFDTPEADEILKRIQMFPKDNPLNWDISYYPAAPNSKQMIEAMAPEGSVRPCRNFNFIIVPPDQKKIPVDIWKYKSESDPGPYPVPENMPVQDWPIYVASLDEVQRNGEGDRHGIVLDPWNGLLYEFYCARKTPQGWEAKQASIFKLSMNHQRPAGFTSTSASGLPELPVSARYDECVSGMVRHAIGVTFEKVRAAYVFPARHKAGSETDPILPRFGERLRLRADYDVSRLSKHAQAVALGMKTHGLIVMDIGSNWDICLTCDKRLEGTGDLMRLKGKDFEVVDADQYIPPPPPPPAKKTK